MRRPTQPADDRRGGVPPRPARRRPAPRPGGRAPGSPQLSSQDLTVLVANLNDRNDQLRREVATLERELGDAQREPVARRRVDRRDPRRPAPRPRLRRASTRSTGPGVTITVSGPIDGGGRRGAHQRAAQRRRRGDRRRRRPARAGRRGRPGRPARPPIDGVALGDAVRARRRSARPNKLTGLADPLRRRHRPARGHAARRRRSPSRRSTASSCRRRTGTSSPGPRSPTPLIR